MYILNYSLKEKKNVKTDRYTIRNTKESVVRLNFFCLTISYSVTQNYVGQVKYTWSSILLIKKCSIFCISK